MLVTAATPESTARALLDEHTAGWSLPQPFYVDDELFALDMEHIFARRWIFVAHTCEVRTAGDWLRVDLGGDSLIVVRGNDGEVRAFYNTCRHRGSLICLESQGHSRRLTCPYHRWTYDLDGSFAGARFLADDFDGSQFGLGRVACRVVGGYIFVCLADNPPDFDQFAEAAEPFLRPHQMDHVKVVHVERLVEHCNWKLVMENNRECYHCANSHPELMHSIDEFDGPGSQSVPGSEAVKSAVIDRWERAGIVHDQRTDVDDEWRVVRLPFTNHAVAMTVDGSPASSKLLGTLDEEVRELGSVRLLHFPNTWNHVQSDHVVSFSVIPLSAGETMLVTRWLVHEDAVEGVDYDFEHLTEVWKATNRQDATLAENNQRGIRSRGYRPGPYQPGIETGTADFTAWYVASLTASLT